MILNFSIDCLGTEIKIEENIHSIGNWNFLIMT